MFFTKKGIHLPRYNIAVRGVTKSVRMYFEVTGRTIKVAVKGVKPLDTEL